MADQNSRPIIGLIVLAGAGAGMLAGAVIGLLVRRSQIQSQEEISETVGDLKRRAELILTELSRAHSPRSIE